MKQQQLKNSNLKFEGDNCRKRSVKYGMDKPEYNFRFHNPNSDEDFVQLLLSVCMESCRKKADAAIAAGLLKEEAIADGTEVPEQKPKRKRSKT